jgi:3-methyladenine DNA glycosylase AlkD
MTKAAREFIEWAKRWASSQAEVQALALVGAFARGTSNETSDVDLVLLVNGPGKYLQDTDWLELFGAVTLQQVEKHGNLTSLRVWYQDGPEVNWGLTTPDWAAEPLDEGTRRVMMDGIRVLFERRPLISPWLAGFPEAEKLYTALVQAIRERANPEFSALNRVWVKNDDYRSYGLKAAQHAEISRLYRTEVRRLSLTGRLHLARRLVQSGMAEEANFANAVLSLSVKELVPADYAYLDVHVGHFHGWGQTDDFCTNVLPSLLIKFPEQTLRLLREWNQAESLWKRRASVVAFVRKVGASGQFTQQMVALCENLLEDKEDLVQKGVGWALKDGMRGDKEQVLTYVKELRKRGVTAVITLYAIRDLKGAERQAVLAIRGRKNQD